MNLEPLHDLACSQFANPAATVGRSFTDTFAGIARASVLGFVLAQAVGTAVGLALIRTLLPYREDVAG